MNIVIVAVLAFALTGCDRFSIEEPTPRDIPIPPPKLNTELHNERLGGFYDEEGIHISTRWRFIGSPEIKINGLCTIMGSWQCVITNTDSTNTQHFEVTEVRLLDKDNLLIANPTGLSIEASLQPREKRTFDGNFTFQIPSIEAANTIVNMYVRASITTGIARLTKELKKEIAKEIDLLNNLKKQTK